MLRLLLARQLRMAWRSRLLRAMAMGHAALAAVVVLAVFVRSPGGVSPRDATAALAGVQLVSGLIVGGLMGGWRLAQLPKSRAVELHLITPLSDWTHLGGELVVGTIRTATLLLGAVPVVALAGGLGWLRPVDATILVLLPMLGGWLAGLLLAMIAYEPSWVRRWLERGVLLAVMVYLVMLGLLGQWVVPRLIGWWNWHTAVPDAPLARVSRAAGYVNPFALLMSAGRQTGEPTWTQLAAVGGLLMLAGGAALVRMRFRLRKHYDELHFGLRATRRRRGSTVGTRPLAWWTARRVSRFKGRVNLYLMWATAGLYGARLLCGESWPGWLATAQLDLLERMGGAALLAAASVQLAVVGAAFLSGLWDSTASQRMRRLELLLVAPLEGRDFFVASAVAAWVRARGYFVGMLVVVLAAALAGHITWPAAAMAVALAAAYFFVSLAVAFRNFARLPDDRTVGLWGLAWSVGWPLVALALFRVGLARTATLTPLGAVYLATLPADARGALTGWTPAVFWTFATAAMVCWLMIAGRLVWHALKTFDAEIRHGFARQLAGGHTDEADRQPARRQGMAERLRGLRAGAGASG